MQVRWHLAAEQERLALPARELLAVQHAIQKLEAEGDQLRFPHTSRVQGSHAVRELRPRAGRSRWRVFYRRIGDALVIGAIGPEAKVDRAGFEAAITAAEERLAALERERQRDG